jgi:hypothetical protein
MVMIDDGLICGVGAVLKKDDDDVTRISWIHHNFKLNFDLL